MKVYAVGGAVRDELLGLPVQDKDYVVVGATPEEMGAKGFKPVGKDFPVFLHPVTHEEYALARTERKSGRGYKGFTVYAAPEVTLEDDLRRRDLTINAMARDEAGRLVDPFGGAKDLKTGVLRHVSDAFAEDPVRILRIARFAARFGFAIHDKTMSLMKSMVSSGEVDALVPERVWQELARGLAESYPERMFEVLEACGARRILIPELRVDADALARAAAAHASVVVRFTVLNWHTPEDGLHALCERLKVPGDARELALTACRCRDALRDAHRATPAGLLETLKHADAVRRSDRFGELSLAARCAEPGTAQGLERLARALRAVQAVDAAAIARQAASPGEIPARLDAARVAAIAQALAA